MPKLAYRATMPKPDDPDIIRRFADATRKGHPVATAATLAGISRVTAQDWLREGNAQLDAGDAEHAGTVLGSHAAFASAHREAEAVAVDAHLAVFNEISNKPGHWQRSAWYLERKYADTFGMRQHTTVDTRTVAVSVTLDALPEGQREALIAALSRTPPQALLEAPEHDITTDE